MLKNMQANMLNIHLMDYLEKKNPHKLDKDITLNERTHVYNVNGNTKFTSVTKWVHSHFEDFNADKVIDNMMNSSKWEQNKYYGKTREQIKREWKNNGIESAKQGTKLHYDIECYYNKVKENKHKKNNSIEYNYFLDFAENNKHLIPWRTEMKVYHDELKLAGSIDMIFEKDDGSGSLMIYDWKRCKDISKTSFGDKCSKTECIEHIPDSNFWHYTLQLNTYKKILEEKYDKNVSDLALICLHPNKKSYEVVKVPILENEITNLFNLRKDNI
jgi:hypothetical protein